MNIEKRLAEIVDKLFLNTGATFSGIFIQDKPVISKTVYSDKKTQLEETLKLIIYKAHQINEFLPDFGEEYVYAEGDNISIFIYFVRPDIAIASIIEEKPKFALLKLEHTSVANKLKSMENEIDNYIKGIAVPVPTEVEEETKHEEPEEHFEPLHEEHYEEMELAEEKIQEEEETQPVEPEEVEEKTEITPESVRDRFAEELEMVEKTEDLEELEKVLSSGEEEETPPLEELLKVEPAETTPLEEVIGPSQQENPPLEELLQAEEETEETEKQEEKAQEEEKTLEHEIENLSEEMEYYDPDVLNKIQQELLKEIGPVGKFLFRKRVKELNIEEDKITRNVLIKLIDKLSDDIIDEKRKKRFAEKVSAFL